MPNRIFLLLIGALLLARPAQAQQSPERRMANIASVAVEEYAKGVDDAGRLISSEEYEEAVSFLAEAQKIAHGLSGASVQTARALLDSVVVAARARRPASVLDSLNKRLAASLGAAGALDLPTAAIDLAEGQRVYNQTCAQCHGATGMGDGPIAKGMDPVPAPIGDPALAGTVSMETMYRVASVGIAGTSMAGFDGALTSQQRWNVVAYVASLQTSPAQARRMGDSLAVQRVTSSLEQALTSLRQGQPDAGDRAFDAYLAFEPIEGSARARSPGLVAQTEKLFGDFRAAVQAHDMPGAEQARNQITLNLPDVIAFTRPAGSGAEAFWQSFVIILREGFEAILVIGAVVAFLLKTGRRDRLRSIWVGVALGLVASGVTAVVLRTVLAALPASGEIIEGVTLLVAVAVLFSVSYWLISRVEAAKWQHFIREKVTGALQQRGGQALAFVAFLAVYREGAETALFFQALFSEGSHLAVPLTLGIVVGFAALAIIFTLFYRYGVRIPLRPFFAVTSALLYYMAFVFMGKGIRELQEGNLIGMRAISGFPHIEALGIYPTWETLLGQALLLVLLAFALVKTFRARLPHESPVSPAPRRDADASRSIP